MRKIIGAIGATLAIAAITGALLSPSKNIPLGDGVDQARDTGLGWGRPGPWHHGHLRLAP